MSSLQKFHRRTMSLTQPSTRLLLNGNGNNGSQTILDSSPVPKALTVVGNTYINTTTKKYGTGSIYFDGVGDYLTIPANTALVFPNDFTIECWFYRTQDLSPYDSLYTTHATASWQAGGIKSNTLVINATGFHGLNLGYTSFSTGYSMPLNVWTHFAVVRLNSTINFYFDGVIKHTELYTGQIGNIAYSPGIGIFDSEGGTPRFFFSGYIDDFRISSVAIYSGAFTPPTTPLS